MTMCGVKGAVLPESVGVEIERSAIAHHTVSLAGTKYRGGRTWLRPSSPEGEITWRELTIYHRSGTNGPDFLNAALWQKPPSKEAPLKRVFAPLRLN